jgi:hypothetical protein
MYLAASHEYHFLHIPQIDQKSTFKAYSSLLNGVYSPGDLPYITRGWHVCTCRH